MLSPISELDGGSPVAPPVLGALLAGAGLLLAIAVSAEEARQGALASDALAGLQFGRLSILKGMLEARIHGTDEETFQSTLEAAAVPSEIARLLSRWARREVDLIQAEVIG